MTTKETIGNERKYGTQANQGTQTKETNGKTENMVYLSWSRGLHGFYEVSEDCWKDVQGFYKDLYSSYMVF